ncbi:MAG: pyridoxal phosphate-dependent aminotransferase [bacterium]
MAISKIIDKVILSPTMLLSQKAIEMRASGIDIVDLTVGEPDFPTPLNIKEAAIRAIKANYTKYTINSGTVELRKAISAKLKNENGLEYHFKNIVVSNGAKQSIFNSILSVVQPGDEVIIPAPFYVSYPEMVKIAQGIPVIVQTSEENRFKITASQLDDAITDKTKLFILCNPSNPTGAAYSKQYLDELAEILEDKEIYILVDEIYEKFVYDDFTFVSFASLSPSIKRKTIIINGVSKAYSMTGWRIGYSAGPPDVIEAINKIQSHSTSNASSVSQMAALEALTGQQSSIEEMRKEFEVRRNFLWKEFNSINNVSCLKPEGAFYLFPNIKKLFNKTDGKVRIENSFNFAMYLLNEVQLACVPGSSFGAESYLRFSYTTSMDVLKEGARRFKTAVEKLQN